MLVLTRKPGEEIIIGGEIRVSVISLGPGRVKIGVEAPEWVTIDRGEVHNRKAVEEEAIGMESTPDVVLITNERVNRIKGRLNNVDPKKSR